LGLRDTGFIVYSGAFTLHGEEKDGISSFNKIPAFGSQMGEIHRSTSGWPAEILGSISMCDLNTNLARIIPKENVRACLQE